LWLALLLSVTASVMSGCGRQPQKQLVVRGGPSLDGLFSKLVAAYEARHPDVRIVPSFSCPPCVMLKGQGDRPELDVFASIGRFEMDRLSEEGRVDFVYTATVGHTALSLISRRGDLPSPDGLAALHGDGLKHIGVGDPEKVAVGYYARQALGKAGLWGELEGRLVYSQSGCELLKWLALGRDIDAAIVFSVCKGDEGDALPVVYDFPAALVPPVPLILGVSRDARQHKLAREFVDFVAGPDARSTLAGYNIQVVDAND